MNAINPQIARTGLMERTRRLPPDQRLILRLNALLYPPAPRNDFVLCLKTAGQRLPDGRGWTQAALNVRVDELVKLGLLSASLDCPAALRHELALEVMASDDAATLTTAITATFPARRSAQYYASGFALDGDNLRRLMHLAVYTNDEKLFTDCAAIYSKTTGMYADDCLASAFYERPLAVDWIAARPPAIQTSILLGKMQAFLMLGVAGADVPALLDYAATQRGEPGFGALGPMLMRFDLLAGRLDVLSEAAAAYDEKPPDHRQALEAGIAFLRGENDTALKLFRDALKAYRKRLGKRKLFLPAENGTFTKLRRISASNQ